MVVTNDVFVFFYSELDIENSKTLLEAISQ